MIIFKDYQEHSIDELVTKAAKHLGRSGEKTLIFKSPTGSGKTLMIAESLKRLVNGENNNLSFIWAAPRKLHNQSKENLELFYSQCQSIKCSFFFDLYDKRIGSNEILFLNWESINKENNLIVRENEREFFLDKVISNTKEEGRDIVLIIDESHFSATTEIASNLINDISPKFTIEVSATPTLKDENDSVIVDIDDVKEEGMIKKSIVFQDGYKNELDNNQLKTIRDKGTDILVLEDALKKRAELQNLYQKIGKDINPLILIQLPDRKGKDEDVLLDKITKHLETSHSISTDNNKLAIYLSEKKENLSNIAKNNNDVQVMLFKQAIALGWDCPRANILVLFRNWKSIDFSIQTIGRIMRMPEPDYGHYPEDALNQGYFFTNIDEIKLNDNYAKNYLSINKSIKKEDTNLSIESCHRLRRREKTRLDPSFISIFLKAADKYDLKNKLSLKNNKISQSIFSQNEYSSLQELQGIEEGNKIEYNLENSEEIQKLFDLFSAKSLSPEFSPEKRSLKRINYSIYKYFEDKLGIDYVSDFFKVIEIVLDDSNINHFYKVIDIAKQQYLSFQKLKANKLVINKSWDIPKEILHLSSVMEMDCSKSIMNPFFHGTLSKPESAFIKYLENSKQVLWWFRNGDRDDTFFALPYKNNNEELPFYVDFIVKFKDKKTGFFDTKDGITITEAFATGKAKGLNQFVSKNKDFIGGIITNTEKDNTGLWKCFTRKTEEYKEGSFENWENINF